MAIWDNTANWSVLLSSLRSITTMKLPFPAEGKSMRKWISILKSAMILWIHAQNPRAFHVISWANFNLITGNRQMPLTIYFLLLYYSWKFAYAVYAQWWAYAVYAQHLHAQSWQQSHIDSKQKLQIFLVYKSIFTPTIFSGLVVLLAKVLVGL